MLNQFAFTLLLLAALLYQACSPSDQNAIEGNAKDTLIVKPEFFLAKSIACDITVLINVSTQSVITRGKIKNQTDSTLKLNLPSWELSGRNGARNYPVEVSSTSDSLRPGEQSEILLIFEPVHDLRMFQETGLRGDVHDTYTLTPMLQHNEDVFAAGDLKISAPPMKLAESVARFGVKNKTIFHAVAHSADRAIANPVQRQGFSNEVRQNGNEILQNGFWTKFSSYRDADTLVIALRMVNQSAGEADFDPGKIIVETDGIKSVPLNESHGFRMKNGGRGEATLRYVVSTELKNFSVRMDGLSFPDDDGKIYNTILFFQEWR